MPTLTNPVSPEGTPAPAAIPAAPPPVRRLRALLGDTVVRHGALSVFDQGIVSATTFATAVLVGRTCTPAELGVYYLAWTIVLLLRGLQDSVLLGPYQVRCHQREGDDLAAYAGSALVHQLTLAALVSAGLLGAEAVLSTGLGRPNIAAAVWVLLGAMPFLLLREFARLVSLAHFRLQAVIAIDVTVAVVQLGGLGLLAYFHVVTVPAVYAVMGLACALACLGWFYFKDQPLHFVPGQFAADWWFNWSFGRWSLATYLLGSTAPHFIPWVLALTHGNADTGLLGACTTLVGLSNLFVLGLGNYLTPKASSVYAREGPAGLRALLLKFIALFAVGLGSLLLLMLAAGGTIAALVFGPDYAGTGPLLALLALAALVNSVGSTAGNGLWAVGRPQANFLADLVSLAVTVVTALLLIGSLGAYGAALAMLAGTVAGTVLRGGILTRRLRAADRARGDVCPA